MAVRVFLLQLNVPPPKVKHSHEGKGRAVAMIPKAYKQGKAGFTLTELLVMVGLLAVLALLLLPAYGDSRTKSREIQCLDNLRRVMNGALLYTHDNHDLFPPNP